MDSVRIKNARVVTKMSKLAYSVSEIWRFYLFCGVWGPILAPLEPNLVVTDNWEYLKLLQMDSVGWKLVGPRPQFWRDR